MFPFELVIPIAVAVVVVLLVLVNGFVSASPAEIKVVSGPWGQRIIHGKTGFKVPLIERVAKPQTFGKMKAKKAGDAK